MSSGHLVDDDEKRTLACCAQCALVLLECGWQFDPIRFDSRRHLSSVSLSSLCLSLSRPSSV